ncbi:MAG TPA: hypothetical protein PKK00_10430 [Bacteroidales bacterium]|nr:hypothetical protein [Bacteroidales bacterium]HPS17739.1 hypothetical protein [Bacteroidales bacterium]
MVQRKRKKKRPKIKYRKLQFKISDKQKKMLELYCNAHKLTLNKLTRKAIKEYLDRHYDIPTDNIVSENQMSIFDLDGVD